jgi:hypothetical protein
MRKARSSYIFIRIVLVEIANGGESPNGQSKMPLNALALAEG